jgi:subtilisin family serine protease
VSSTPTLPVRTTLLAGALLAIVVGAPGALRAAPEAGEIAPASHPPAFAGAGVRAELAERDRIPVIVTLRGGGLPSTRNLTSRRTRIADLRRRALESAEPRDVHVTAAWGTAPAFAATVNEAGLADLLSSPEVLRVDADEPVRATLDQSSRLIRSNEAHVAGVTGKGVTVAVLDTGIDTDHADLADDLVAERCFARLGSKGACPDGSTSQSGPGSAEDDDGHGTLVSSIITSRGSASPRGVAPDAKIVALKVLGPEGGSDSGIISALDWLIASRPDVKVVNMSLGGDLFRGACDGTELAYASVLNALRSRGVTVFVASGNDASPSSIGSPACVSSAVSVGAVYDANGPGMEFSDCEDNLAVVDRVACFSNSADGLDLLAPGALITSGAKGGGSEAWVGTSAATPHAAGVAALLLQVRPDLSPDQIESTLESTGVRVTDHRNGKVFPRIDALAALNAARPLPPPTAPPPYLRAATTTFPDPTGDAVGPDLATVTLTSTLDGLLIFSIVTPNRMILAANETIWTILDVDRNASTGSSQGGEFALVTPAGGTGTTELLRWSNGAWRPLRTLADSLHGGGVATVKVSQDELGTRSDLAVVVQTQTAATIADRSPAAGSWPFPSLPLLVTRSGTGGGTVSSVDPGGISCGSVCTGAFARGSQVTLNAVPGAGSAFVGWGGACAGAESCTVAMTDVVSVAARFELLRRLAVAKEGTGRGTVTAGSAIACGDTCSASLPHGSTVVFAAQPDPGSRFDGWTGACAGAEPCELAIDGDKAVAARFTDVMPPTAVAFASSARRGRLATLRFRIGDNGAGVRVEIDVYSGKRKLAILRPGALAPGGELETAEWKVPKRFEGKGRFCVRGIDVAGNTGNTRCAALRVR